MTDLFGHQEPERCAAGDLFEGSPRGLRLALAEKRETLRMRERAAALRPDHVGAALRLATARRDYLQLRDYMQRISADELRASLVASGEASTLPTDNAELWGAS